MLNKWLHYFAKQHPRYHQHHWSQSKYYFFKPQIGQALLEITIATGLAILVITAITITSIIGLRNGQFSQNQIQATKLAQEGLERVRNIRDADCIITTTENEQYTWYGDTNNIWSSIAELETKTFNLIVNANPSDGGCRYTLTEIAPNSSAEKLQNNFFSRSIMIKSSTPADPNVVRIYAVVSWTDFSGTHNSELVTDLTKRL